MKKFYLYLILVLLVNSNLLAKDMNIIPLFNNYSNIIEIDNQIIILADYGIISLVDEYEKIEKIKVFNKGKIINVIKSNNEYFSINEFGEVSKSNNLKVWNSFKSLDILVDEIIPSTNGLIFGNKSKISFYDYNFNLIKYIENIDFNYFTIKNAIIEYNNEILVSNDFNLSFQRYDLDFNYIDSISLKELEILKDFSQSSILFFKTQNKLIISLYNRDLYNQKKDYNYLIETMNLKDFNLINKNKINIYYYNFTSDKIYCVAYVAIDTIKKNSFIIFELNNSTQILDSSNINQPIQNSQFTDFFVFNNKVYICGNNDYISIFEKDKNKIETNKLNSFGNNLGVNNFSPPIIIEDNVVFDNSITFTNTDLSFNEFIPNPYNIVNDTFNWSRAYKFSQLPSFKFKDEKNNKFIIGNNNPADKMIYISEDNGKSFILKQYGGINISKSVSFDQIEGYYYIASNNFKYNSDQTAFFDTGNIDFIRKDSLIDDYGLHIVIDSINLQYAYVVDTNNIFILYNNPYGIGNILFSYSDDKGESLQILKEFDADKLILKHKQIKIENKNNFVIMYYDQIETKVKIDMFDFESKEFTEIFSKDIDFIDLDFGFSYINIDENSNNLYFSINDIIYELNNKSKIINEYQLPNNGRILSEFKIYDDNYILTNYKDDFHKIGTYKLNNYKNMISSVENNIEEFIFLEITNPYPNPSTNFITTRVYWGRDIEINIENIGIYDIMGNKINSNDNIRLEKFNNYSGNVVWDTSNQPKGTYLLKIQHGNNTKSVKIMVE